MPNNPDSVNLSTLPETSDRIKKGEIFPAGLPIDFLPAEKVFCPAFHLGGTAATGFQDERKVSSGIPGLSIVFGQASHGPTSIGFAAGENSGILEIKMLCQTTEDSKSAVAWSENLLANGRLERHLTSNSLNMEQAMAQTRAELAHPTIILRVKNSSGSKDVRVKAIFKGTADNWNIDPSITTGLTAARVG